jgi:hypothetical protein
VNRRLRRGLVLLLAVSPFVAAPIVVRAFVPRLGDRMARQAVAAAALMAVRVEVRGDAAPQPEARIDEPRPPVLAAKTRSAATRKREDVRQSIVLSKDRLLRLTERQLRAVGWTTVVNANGHAAGVRLSGIGALGVGLADGDVVTSINGRPTATEDEATAAGFAAWLSGAPAAQATILRGDQLIGVRLELPPRPERVR